MISSSHRVSKNLFPKALSSGKNSSGTLHTLHVSKIEMPKSKFSVVVSKKVEKSAVKRNLLRRRCYSILKESEPSLEKGIYLLFLKKDSARASFGELQSDINDSLKRYK